ncbi:Gamma-glutamyltranspeptidase 1 [Blattella germanica]|nr:Gamma-glutamyltranspeptidase 1 [Blattella germanica]
MDDFSMPNTTSRWGTMPSETNFVYPGKRPLSSMCPVIIVDEKGDVRLVIGGSGGIRIITSVALVLVRYLWLKQSIKEAINGKRIHHQLVPNILEYEHGLDEVSVIGLSNVNAVL